MLGAETAVVGAAAVRLRAEPGRHLPLDTELHPVVLPRIGADEVLAHAVGRAALAEVNAAVAGNDGSESEDVGPLTANCDASTPVTPR